ncbi:nucleotide-binding universal stress UspA family protein [Geothermobacter ehrlichii]|uniref:Nucleotide-binding universal stress UspA family protein n=1 Tax=Geothermobacter ehrlichii TaxID=213224 RepID=A0A5D3WHI7_9BACT|nr:universal stress protein [Geothermobacter ehrlichii]TYO94905.1 nucleotide-binding universal stress UspA family protein [Geothermobacter ehrlichii]
MNARILIPIDDSETTEKAVSGFLGNRTRFPDRVTLLHVLEDKLSYRGIPEAHLASIRERARQAGQRFLEQMAERFRKAGFNPELRLESGDPVAVIKKIDAEEEIFLLVMARHEGGGEVSDILFGSVTNAVMHKVKCPMLLF